MNADRHALRILNAIQEAEKEGFSVEVRDGALVVADCYVLTAPTEEDAPWGWKEEPVPEIHAAVILFKPSGKYYTEESWRVPEDAIGPYDMARSPDARRIGGGPVLVPAQEPWGFPHLFPALGGRDLEGGDR